MRVTREHNEECKKLLSLMGIPVVTVSHLRGAEGVKDTDEVQQAPGEAEAQCAELARAGKVYAAGSEDMDTLTFNSPILLRHLTFSEAKRMPISEIHLDVALRDLEMSMGQVSFMIWTLTSMWLTNVSSLNYVSSLVATILSHVRA